MRKFNKIILLLLVPLSIALAAGAYSLKTPVRDPNAVYRVALGVLPVSLSPFKNNYSISTYVISHLYWPLFRLDSKGELSSPFLDMSKSRAVDDQFADYYLCLKPGLYFSNGDPITTLDLKVSLETAHHDHPGLFAGTVVEQSESECVKVHFPRPIIDYFHKLTGWSATILHHKTVMNDIPVGSGPYRLVSRSETEWVLEAIDGRVTGNIKTIHFYLRSALSHDQEKSIDDWNFSGQNGLPTEYRERFNQISVALPRTRMMVLRLKDEAKRKRLAYCMNRLKGPFLEVSGLNAIGTPVEHFLPAGYPGSEEYFNLDKQFSPSDCLPQAGGGTPVEFKYYYANSPELADFFRVHGDSLPEPIRFSARPPKHVIHDVQTKDEFITVLLFEPGGRMGQEGVDSYSLFDGFLGDLSVVPGGIPELRSVLDQLHNTQNSKQQLLYRKARSPR